MADQPPPPTDDQIATLDAAREAVIKDQTHTDRQRTFFEALFGLPAWYVLAGETPAGAAEGQLPALLTVSDNEGRRIMPVFSSPERAGRQHAIMHQSQATPPTPNIISLAVPMGLAYLCHIHDEVPFAIFDNVTNVVNGFGIDAKALPSWYDNTVGPCPVECLKVITSVASETGAAGAYGTAFRSIINHGRVIVARRPDGALLVANEGGRVFVPVFSTEAMAATITEHNDGVKLEAAPVGALLPTLKELRTAITQDGFIGMVFDPGHATLVLHEELWEQAGASLQPAEQAEDAG